MVILSRGLESAVIKKLSNTPSVGGAGVCVGGEVADGVAGAGVKFATL